MKTNAGQEPTLIPAAPQVVNMPEMSEEISKETRSKIFYALGAFVVLSCLGIIGHFVNVNPVIPYYLVTVTIFIVLGLLHILLADWLGFFKEKKFSIAKPSYAMIISLLSCCGYFIVFYFLSHKSGYTVYFFLSPLYFMIPQWLLSCLESALEIPARKYKIWHYKESPFVNPDGN